MLYIIFFAFQIMTFHNKNTSLTKVVEISRNLSDTLPNFKLQDEKNNYISMYEIKPKAYILVTIWNSKCTSCQNEMRKLDPLYNEYQKSITFISVSNDINKKEWGKSIARYNFKGINLLDTKKVVSKVLDLKEYPAFILLDPNYVILEKFYSVIQVKKRLNEYYFIYDGLRVRNSPD